MAHADNGGRRSLRLGELLHFRVNDGLMAIFFLSWWGWRSTRDPRRRALRYPARRAPHRGRGRRRYCPGPHSHCIEPGAAHAARLGVPMATISRSRSASFCRSGRRAPAALRVLLLALAIIDDIGAILVIAIFYSSGVVWSETCYRRGRAPAWSRSRPSARGAPART